MTTKQFKKLAPAKQRVLIAEDVIATLKLPQRYIPVHGTYMHFKLPKRVNVESESDIRSALPKIEKHCKVCAKGALFISMIRIADGVTFSQVDTGYEGTEGDFYADDELISKEMAGSFPKSQLDTIESVFERWGTDSEKWHKKFPYPEDKLRAICENIVRNNGDFDIADLPA